jgi:hypothetical protein
MTVYALINDENEIVRTSSRVNPEGGVEVGWKWLPVVDTKPLASVNQIRTGPVVTVEQEQVSRVWTVRDKTPQELDAEKDGLVDDAAVSVIGKILFNHENRIRTLNSQAPVTAAQFKAAIKALL